ncbi:hypothetical protein QT397_18965 [Microbulbifer sp. MKSA007]|nr:hypothetical protein QT397_18965 [Microbulbifer sp. MKSA007]
MNIEKLRRIRNKNTEQQNELSFLEMKECVDKFINDESMYPWLTLLLSQKGMSANEGILLNCSEIFEQYGTQWMGTWLTKKKEFYEFDVMTDRANKELLEIDGWSRVYHEVSAHSKGIGKTPAFIALELLSEYGQS